MHSKKSFWKKLSIVSSRQEFIIAKPDDGDLCLDMVKNEQANQAEPNEIDELDDELL